MADYYKVLGVSDSADQEVITAAYRAMARKYHPDVNKSADAEDRLKSLNEAYETLSDPQSRTRYDAERKFSRGAEKDQDDDLATDPLPRLDPQRSAYIASRVPHTSILSDTVYLIVIVPVFWLIAIFVAQVSLQWIIIVIIDWSAPSDYSIGEAFRALVEVIRNDYKQLIENATPDVTQSPSIILTALTALWLFIVSGAATGAVSSNTWENRPRIHLWLVGTLLLIFFGGISYLRDSHFPDNASRAFIINTVVGQIAILAGIFWGINNERAERAKVEQECSW